MGWYSSRSSTHSPPRDHALARGTLGPRWSARSRPQRASPPSNGNAGAGHAAAPVPGQEGDDRRHLLRPEQAAQRLLAGEGRGPARP